MMLRPLSLAALLLALAGPASAGFSTVVLDPGHGGHDRGGIPGQAISEKAMTLDLARRVRAKLQAAGLTVVMTRNGDYFVGLDGRTAVANARPGSVFVSVHFNSGYREGADGIETYYYSRQGAALAASIHRRLVAAAGTEDRGVKQHAYYVLRHTKRAAVLLECGFLTNRREGRRILGSGHRERLAAAIAAGIIAQSQR